MRQDASQNLHIRVSASSLHPDLTSKSFHALTRIPGNPLRTPSLRNSLGVTKRHRGRRDALLVGSLVGLQVGQVLEVVQRLELGVAAEQDVALDPPGQEGADLVLDEGARGHRKDPVELLERALLCLRHEEEDHEEGDHVEAGVETECTLGISVRLAVE